MIAYIDTKLIALYHSVKKYKDKILLHVLKPFAKRGVIADSVSMAGLLIGILSAISLHYSKSLFITFWSGKRITDIIDGPLSKLNKKKWFNGINADHLSDITFSFVLFLAMVPIVGIFWPTIAIITYILHLLCDFRSIGKSIFAPKSDYAQFMFLLGMYKEGIMINISYTISAFILSRLIKSA